MFNSSPRGEDIDRMRVSQHIRRCANYNNCLILHVKAARSCVVHSGCREQKEDCFSPLRRENKARDVLWMVTRAAYRNKEQFSGYHAISDQRQ